jgi:hypothetical protein
MIAVLSLTAVSVFADKPKWAGEGGKPSDYEIEQHRDDMRDKNNDKSNHKGKGKDKDKDDWDWDQDKDKDKDKDKNKNKNKKNKK